MFGCIVNLLFWFTKFQIVMVVCTYAPQCILKAFIIALSNAKSLSYQLKLFSIFKEIC